MLSPEIIARIKSLNLRGRHLATDVMTGDYASAFHGRGMEFHEVREYVPGDDVRGIDWNVTARMNQPFIKVFREERELTLMLAVDVSASLTVGQGRTRRAAAVELAAVLAWLAIRSNDRVGLLLFGRDIELYLPPRKGQAHVWRIVKELLTWGERSSGTNISVAVDHIGKVLKRRAVCFLISDFLTNENLASLARVAKQHDLTCVLTDHGPLDGQADAGGVGVVAYKDLESGQTITINTSDKGLQRHVIEFHQTWQKNLETAVRDAGADFFKIQSERSVVDPLAEYLRRHGGRRRVGR